MELIDTLKYKFKNGNLPTRLIFINSGIFILLILWQLVSKSTYDIVYNQLALPGNLNTLWHKPWTLFTYMFVHGNVWHLVVNMFMLYAVSEFFYRYFGKPAFVRFYFVGGILGGLFYTLINTFLIHDYSVLVGASAAIFSLLFAMVAYRPNLRINLMFVQTPIKLLHLAIGFVVLGFLLNTDNLGGNLSHVGGALFGYFYMKLFEKGNDPLQSIEHFFSNLFKSKPKVKSGKKTPPRDDYDYNEYRAEKRERVDDILDKISRSGYSSLTTKEKEFLFKQGKGR